MGASASDGGTLMRLPWCQTAGSTKARSMSVVLSQGGRYRREAVPIEGRIVHQQVRAVLLEGGIQRASEGSGWLRPERPVEEAAGLGVRWPRGAHGCMRARGCSGGRRQLLLPSEDAWAAYLGATHGCGLVDRLEA